MAPVHTSFYTGNSQEFRLIAFSGLSAGSSGGTGGGPSFRNLNNYLTLGSHDGFYGKTGQSRTFNPDVYGGGGGASGYNSNGDGSGGNGFSVNANYAGGGGGVGIYGLGPTGSDGNENSYSGKGGSSGNDGMWLTGADGGMYGGGGGGSRVKISSGNAQYPYRGTQGAQGVIRIMLTKSRIFPSNAQEVVNKTII